MNIFEEIDKVKDDLPKTSNIKKVVGKRSYNVYQATAIVVMFIFVIAGVIMGSLYPACGVSSNLYSNCNQQEFNIALTVGVWFSGFLFSMFIYGLGHIIALLTSINNKLDK